MQECDKIKKRNVKYTEEELLSKRVQMRIMNMIGKRGRRIWKLVQTEMTLIVGKK